MIRALSAAAMLALAVPAQAQQAPSPPPAAAPALEGIVGPALYVTDPARSLKFYAEGLGMKLRMRFGPADRPDMVLGFGPDPSQAGIMLVTDKQGPVRAIEHGHGYDRFAIRLPDLDAVNARLRAAGFAGGEIRMAHGSVRLMFVTDPDGYRIEIIDSKPPVHSH